MWNLTFGPMLRQARPVDLAPSRADLNFRYGRSDGAI